MTEFPEHWMKRWKFAMSSERWWMDLERMIRVEDPIGTAVADAIFEEIALKCGLASLRDWSDKPNLIPPKLKQTIRKMGGFISLSKVYPGHAWDLQKLADNSPRRTVQRQLRKRVTYII